MSRPLSNNEKSLKEFFCLVFFVVFLPRMKISGWI
jgi:hypothetical protein